MNNCKPFKRTFRIGAIVRLLNQSRPMRILKYDDKLSTESGKHIVSVTWRDRGEYHVSKVEESALVSFTV